MEAYLDWQSKSGGIKLNDVIEEYRYVAAGKSVKKGDFLTYVGDDVAPAIEPPFNAVALSSGVGGTEHIVEREVTKTGNIFPSDSDEWVEKEEGGTRTTSTTGYVLESSSTNSSSYLHRVCNEQPGNPWTSENDDLSQWVMLTCPKSEKITKMKIYVTSDTTSRFSNAVIQGSKDGDSWTDLHTISAYQTALTEIELENADYYTYYKVTITFSRADYAKIYQWQTSEYIVKEQVPSAEHNEQVKIARVYKEVEVEKTFAGNIFPTSTGWTAISAPDYYQKEDGTKVSGLSWTDNYYVYNIFTGGSDWLGKSGNSWAKIELPEPKLITKMSMIAKNRSSSSDQYTLILQASNNDVDWDTLWTRSKINNNSESTTRVIDITNGKSYKYYMISFECALADNFELSNWQTVEYIEKVTEVIQ